MQYASGRNGCLHARLWREPRDPNASVPASATSTRNVRLIKMRRAMRQLELRPHTWGGRRDGAGRRPTPGRRAVPHARRSPHDPRCPAHVTLRACAGVPSLRSERLLPILRNALRAASTTRFRLLAFSVQSDHLHLVVEADEPTGLARGMQGLAIRLAKSLNRALARRGSVWGDRYHSRILRTPREVRNVLAYVLNNFRKHLRVALGLDPYSSTRRRVGSRGGRLLVHARPSGRLSSPHALGLEASDGGARG